MEKFSVLKDIVIILLFSIPIVYLFKKIKISTIVGYLITGVIIGPFGLGLISGSEQIEVMAEIGVIMLMFTIGLEFSIEKLLKMKKLLFYAGGLQVLLTIIVCAILFSIFGVPVHQSIFFGMLVSMTSTTIMMKLLIDRNEIDTPHSKIGVSISLFQDMSIVPMMILLPVLGAKESLTFSDVFSQIGFAVGLLVAVLFLAKILVPKLLFYFAKIRIREIFTIGILFLILGTAFITDTIGLSFSIGAFIAGVIISESEFSSEIVAEILPFKDAFNSIFFVSIGLLLNVLFLIEYPFLMIVLVIGTIVLKATIVLLVVLSMKYSLRVAVLSGLINAQIGEFAFILAQAGLGIQLISGEYYNAFIAATIFSMLLNPFLVEYAPFIFRFFNIKEKEEDKSFAEIALSLKKHVIIVGFGLNGKNLASVLKETGIQYIIIELNPDTVMRCKSAGENIMYGDVTKKEILHQAGVQEASVIVFAISDPIATQMALRFAKQMNPDIYTIVRTRYISEVNELMKLGADEVIPEEFETSLQIFSKVLSKYHIPLNIIMKQVSLLREGSYNMMLDGGDARSRLLHLNEILAAGLTEIYYVDETNKHIGKTLGEIDLRAKTGATIIAIVRNEKTISIITADEKLNYKDTIVITGNHKAVDDAISLLNGKD
ncbi:MAG TPA: cation:proton antiporter [Ignavibacteriaceae bacterium]|nr:cation:proton antiporter [Ignavibacteriaceae bacterium]